MVGGKQDMVATREKDTESFVEKLPCLFALGGDKLAFYEICTLAQVFRKRLGYFRDVPDDELRCGLDSHPLITTTNGNYYTYHGDDLVSLGVSLLSPGSGRPELALDIASALPNASTEGVLSSPRLSRDLRNSLFVADFRLHKVYLDRLKELHSDFALGSPYWFMADVRHVEWVSSLPKELLSISIRMVVPYMLYNLLEIKPLLDAVMPLFNSLGTIAKLPLVDALIMTGRFEEASDCLSGLVNADADALKTRYCWLDFIHGNNSTAVANYVDALENLRRPNYGCDYYFTTITGIFFILALIRENTQSTLGMAYSNARIGMGNELHSKAYEILQTYLGGCLRGGEVSASLLDGARGGMECLIASLVAFWMYEEQIGEARIERIRDLLESARKGGYAWIACECEELLGRLDANWIPDESRKKYGVSVVPLVDCVRVLPAWTLELNDVVSSLDAYFNQRVMRTEWRVSFSPMSPTTVVLELFEQHKTKTDKWSKGQKIRLESLARDLRQGLGWPAYFTAQDIRAASLLMGMHGLLEDNPPASVVADTHSSMNGTRQESYSLSKDQCMSHNDVLFWLKDYQQLYWADDGDRSPIRIVMDEPYVQMQRDASGKVKLNIYPKVAPHSHLSAVRYEDGSLHVFCFSQIHRVLAEKLVKGVSVPEQAVARLNDTCFRLAQLMRIKSDYDLSSLAVQSTRMMDPHAVFRLERQTSGLSVELLVRPFGEGEPLCKPGEGPHAIVDCKEGFLVRKLRDMAGEDALVSSLLSVCLALNAGTMTGVYRWTIENGDGVYHFLTQLGELGGESCSVQWKQERKLSMSRKIGFGDVSMRTQHVNNWLEVDGDIALDEDMSISFQRLLDLSKTQKGNFITLNDGQIISLADELREALDHLNTIGQYNRQGQLQFTPLSLPVLQVVLDKFQQLEITDEWREQIRRIDEAKEMDVPLPTGLAKGTKLRGYQQEGYRWLVRLDHWGAGACLADDMGLGKTIQAIAFMVSVAQDGPALVVAPTSVCPNWVDEIARFAPSLKTVVFGQGNREEMLKAMKPGMVMVSSYGLLQSQISCFEHVEWRVVILDEAQAIKNYQAKRSQAALQLKSKFRIATTGTPIENNLVELWTLFQFITPGLFGTRQSFQDRFTGPMERAGEKESAMQRLGAMIRPFLLRRKKDEVLKELPPKTEVQLHVDLSLDERAFYEAVRQNLLRELEAKPLENLPQDRIRILAAITKLRQAACNPLLIEPGTGIQSAKLEEFKRLVQDLVAGGHKTLVFSQFVKHLGIIRPCLESMGITYDYLDGSTPTREREDAVKNFQEGNSDLFLISLRAGGLGLNLTRADYVIILDPWWNPAVEDQAADRAHRLGQSRPVTIYRIIARNTIEDKIIELHKQKQDLAEQLLDGSDTAGAISAEELLKLLQDAQGTIV